MKKHLKAAAGFTLVELIVVIAILGILAGVAVPVYSGYVKKANLAADQTLVDSINTAFAAACIENGVDIINDVESSEAQITIDDEGVWTPAMVVDGEDLTNDFLAYMGGSTAGTKFKVVKDNEITFSDTTHMFEIDMEKVSVAFGDYEFSISQKLAAALSNDNTFKTLGASSLTGKVDKVSDIAASLVTYEDAAGNPSVFKQLVFATGENDEFVYLKNLQTTLGMENEEFSRLIMNDDGTWRTDVLANSLVLTAAQQTIGMDTSFLGTTGSATTLRNELNDPATATQAMAKLALTYGMYTAYVQTNPDMEDKSEALLEQGEFSGMTAILADIESEEFRTYLAGEQGQKDLNAYMASMQIVNDSANQSSEAAQDILTNGFSDPNLVGALNDLMNG